LKDYFCAIQERQFEFKIVAISIATAKLTITTATVDFPTCQTYLAERPLG